MGQIIVYNRTLETHDGENNFKIFRPSILSNPYTHIKDKKTLASFVVSDRDTAIEMYEKYFDLMYGSNMQFTNEVDKIYNKYKSGENVYLECYCKPLRCHGDIIKEKLERRLIKEKIQNRRNKNV